MTETLLRDTQEITKRLLFNISSREPARPITPDLPQPLFETTSEEKQLIDQLAAIKPELVVAAIFSHPPTIVADVNDQRVELNPQDIQIIPPTELELKWAKKEVQINSDVIPDVEDAREVGKWVKFIQTYLMANRVKDDFTLHDEQRRVWEGAIERLLVEVDERRAHLFRVKEDKKDGCLDHFQKLWSRNKYSRGYMTHVIAATTAILPMIENYHPQDLDAADEIRARANEIRSDLEVLREGVFERRGRLNGVQVRIDPLVENLASIDSTVDLASLIGIKTLALLGNLYTKRPA